MARAATAEKPTTSYLTGADVRLFAGEPPLNAEWAVNWPYILQLADAWLQRCYRLQPHTLVREEKNAGSGQFHGATVNLTTRLVPAVPETLAAIQTNLTDLLSEKHWTGLGLSADGHFSLAQNFPNHWQQIISGITPIADAPTAEDLAKLPPDSAVISRRQEALTKFFQVTYRLCRTAFPHGTPLHLNPADEARYLGFQSRYCELTIQKATQNPEPAQAQAFQANWLWAFQQLEQAYTQFLWRCLWLYWEFTEIPAAAAAPKAVAA